jgi:hypothetical protein
LAGACIVGGATLVGVNAAAGWTMVGTGIGLALESLAE